MCNRSGNTITCFSKVAPNRLVFDDISNVSAPTNSSMAPKKRQPPMSNFKEPAAKNPRVLTGDVGHMEMGADETECEDICKRDSHP